MKRQIEESYYVNKEKKNSKKAKSEQSNIKILEYEERIVQRRIIHKWQENDGSLKSYHGKIMTLSSTGICSVVYNGSFNVYKLNIHELYEDFQIGDLTFLDNFCRDYI